jgi:hypothetical protein
MIQSPSPLFLTSGVELVEIDLRTQVIMLLMLLLLLMPMLGRRALGIAMMLITVVDAVSLVAVRIIMAITLRTLMSNIMMIIKIAREMV